MPGPGTEDPRFYSYTRADTVAAAALARERRLREARLRRREETLFDEVTRDLRTAQAEAAASAPPTQRCGEPVPPMHFTDDELEWF